MPIFHHICCKNKEACISILTIEIIFPFFRFGWNLIIVCYMLLFPYRSVYRWSFIGCIYECYIYFLFYHQHIQITLMCSCLFGNVILQYHGFFRSIRSWSFNVILWDIEWIVVTSIVWFFCLPVIFLLL